MVIASERFLSSVNPLIENVIYLHSTIHWRGQVHFGQKWSGSDLKSITVFSESDSLSGTGTEVGLSQT